MSSLNVQAALIDNKREDTPILFPTGLKFSHAFDNPDEMASYATKWRQEYYQISSGKFSGTMQIAHTNSLQIGRETWSPGIFIRGDIPEKSLIFSVSAMESKPPLFCNRPLETDELILLREGDEADFLSSCPQDMLTVSIDRDSINRYLIGLIGKEFESIHTDDKVLKLMNESARKELVDQWNQTLELALSPANDLEDNNFQSFIEEKLIGSLLSKIYISEYSDSRAERHRVAMLARQYIIENKNKQFSMLDICEAVGSTKRTIHMGFQEIYGIAPKTFLKYLRLNNVKKELSQAKPRTTVTDVVISGSFFLSRFAKNYNEVFGEYPSETLKRSTNLNYSTK